MKYAHPRQVKDVGAQGKTADKEENKKEEVDVLLQRKNMKLKYILEEKRNDDKGMELKSDRIVEPTKFNGYEDSEFASSKDGTANYALMIYDVS